MKEVIVTGPQWDGENEPTGFMDFIGQTVRVGDYVVYPTSSGHAAQMVLGIFDGFVLKDKEGNFKQSWFWNGDTRELGFTYSVRIQPLIDSRFSRGTWNGGKKNKVSVSLTQNIVKVDGSQAIYELED